MEANEASYKIMGVVLSHDVIVADVICSLRLYVDNPNTNGQMKRPYHCESKDICSICI